MSCTQTCLRQKHVYDIDFANVLCEIIHMRLPRRPKPDADFGLKQFYHDVGLLIREARKKADNMTQEALASSVGLTRTSLTNIEKGRQRVLLHTFTQIASAVGAEPVDLLPKKQNVLNGLGVDLPSSLAPEERGFIERAIGAGGNYETIHSKENRDGGKQTASGNRNSRGAD
jgi:DNA-binding XRE family transcriptional regulator